MSDHRAYRERSYAFGRQLLQIRLRIALSQTMLAAAAGVHHRTVQNWETGVSYPKAEALQRLIAALVQHQALTSGQEHEEAAALWQLVEHDGPRSFPSFDEAWFSRMLAAHSSAPAEVHPERAHQIIDWGEAIAVPTLYGREPELATLHQWIVTDRCRVIALIGLGGIGKSSLAITSAYNVLQEFDLVLFRSLQNGPPLGEVLDQIIHAIAAPQLLPADQISDKIALLVQLFRKRRCLLILDNLEAILQPGALTGSYRTGYADYSLLLERLSEREHQSCIILTSREKPAEIGRLEGSTTPVRTLAVAGLDDTACDSILKNRDVFGMTDDVRTLTHLYGGNPLALHLVIEPIRELFGGSVSAFLAAGDAFFNGLGKLMEQQCARTTPLEHAIIRWLAIERELVPVDALLVKLGESVQKRDVLVALESLRRRVQIERGPHQPAFTLQPVILEFVTDQMISVACKEIVAGQPQLLQSHAFIEATTKDYLRLSQELLIATPLLERLISMCGGVDAAERKLLGLLTYWRDQPLAEQGYGPGNVINLIRLLRGHLRGLDLSRLLIRQAYLQGIEAHNTILADAVLQDYLFTETFDAILAVAISSTGAYRATSSRSGEVRLWMADGQIMHRTWRAHSDMVWSLTFSPDERMLATAGWDGGVKLWDIASGVLLWSGKHAGHVNSVAFAPDGKTLATGGNDSTVRLWDTHSGAHLQTLPHPGPVSGSGVTWSADGRLLASGDTEGSIRIWEIPKTGQAMCIHTLTGHQAFVDGLAFSPDGNSLASAGWDGAVKLWEMPGGHLQETLTGHTGRTGRVAWSPDGQTLAVSGYDPTIWLWDIQASRYRATLHGHTDGVCGLAFTPDSRTLLSCGNGALRVWDATSGRSLRVIQGYEDVLCVVDWSPDSTRLVSGGMDGLVTIWSMVGAMPRQLSGHSGSICGVGWSPTGRWLASSEWENAIRLSDPDSGICFQTLKHPDDSSNTFYGLMWSPDGQRLACGTSRRGIFVWDVKAQRQQWASTQCPTFIRQITWNPDGTLLAGGGDDGAVYIWDATTGLLLKRLEGHRSLVTSVAWSPEGQRLASGGKGTTGGELCLWDAMRWERIRSVAKQIGNVYALAWGADAATLVSGDGDGRLCWWNIVSGEYVRIHKAHQGTVQALRRSPDGARVASCGDDGAITIWDLETGVHLQTLRRDRPYERMDITGLTGITEAQRATLLALGAIEHGDMA